MPNQAFTETLTFTRCQNWNTETCPQRKGTQMQLSILNSPHHWLLGDRTVKDLNDLCDGCEEFKKK